MWWYFLTISASILIVNYKIMQGNNYLNMVSQAYVLTERKIKE